MREQEIFYLLRSARLAFAQSPCCKDNLQEVRGRPVLNISAVRSSAGLKADEEPRSDASRNGLQTIWSVALGAITPRPL